MLIFFSDNMDESKPDEPAAEASPAAVDEAAVPTESVAEAGAEIPDAPVNAPAAGEEGTEAEGVTQETSDDVLAPVTETEEAAVPGEAEAPTNAPPEEAEPSNAEAIDENVAALTDDAAVEGEPAETGEAITETNAKVEDEPEPVQVQSQEDEQIETAEMFLAEEEDLMPLYNREELVQRYQVSIMERDQLNQQNQALQHKLAEYFKKKKTEEARHEVDKNVTDQEQRYMKYVNNLEELRQQQMVEQEEYNERLEEMKERKAEKQAKVEEEWQKSIEFKKSVAAAAINSRSGRPIPPKDIEIYEINERKKEAEVAQVRLENIKLKNRLLKQEMQLKQKEELAEGLHLIDFEQLKIENQTYNEKIEERNEELLKLRKKITSTVQVLTHLKEKLQFVQAENQVKKQQLTDVDLEVAKKRDILSRTKQTRDALRHDNAKLQQKCGLLGNYDLLRDFEETHDEGDDLKSRLEVLKRTHAELTLNLNGVKKKIELAKENQA